MDVFDRALDVPIEQRAGFLEAECGDDAALHQELTSLLEAHESVGDYFDDLADSLVSPAYGPVLRAAHHARESALRPELEAALGSTYRILRGLGGGMSRVFLAEEIKLGRKVVIKVLPPEMAASANAGRFRREIQLVAQLQHPHIVSLLTSDSANSLLYYTMPFMEGESLRARLEREGALPIDDARKIWRDVLDALSYAHARGIIHRDIKPGNILLSERNALVSDFGIAHALEAAAGGAGETPPGVILGTPAYVAPEQVTGDGSADHRADIYAAGLVMFEMLEGRLPFSGDTRGELVAARLTSEPRRLTRPECPPELAALVMECLARRPEDRPHTVADVLAMLEARPRTADARPRRRVLARIIAASVLAAAALGTWALVNARAGAPPRRLTASVEAHEWYERGMDVALIRTSAGRVQAREYLNRAIAADSSFAAAWAGLVHTYTLEAGGTPGNYHEWYSRAEEAALKAVALDSTLAESHAALGFARSVLRKWSSAEVQFKRAVAINPRAPRALEGLARVYMWTQRPAEQLTTARQGLEVEPYSHSAIREMALALGTNGRCDEAIEQLRPLKELSPPAGVAGVVAGQCYAAKEMWTEAIGEFRWAMETSEARAALAFLGHALARAGQRDEAEVILSDLMSGRKYSHGAFGIATVYAGLREYEKAFAWLDKAVDENSLRPYLMGPMYADLHRDPRFARLKKRMGL